MKAVRIHESGSTAQVVRCEEVPIPEQGCGELLVKIEAASLNGADLALRKSTCRIVPRRAAGYPRL
jgi:NADPH:quinone reductase-like Zn-dependent oxidoreductase